MNRHNIYRLLLVLLMSWSLVPRTRAAQSPSQIGRWYLGPLWDIAPINIVVASEREGHVLPGNAISGDDAPRMGPGDQYDDKSSQGRLRHIL